VKIVAEFTVTPQPSGAERLPARRQRGHAGRHRVRLRVPRHLPDGAENFTTIELKSNHLGTARDGVIECVAKAGAPGPHHAGVGRGRHQRRNGKTIAIFRCTQMILYPKTN
jgi:acyl-coenzyme A thioesterase PaaI-like protein